MAALAYRGESMNEFAKRQGVSGTAISYVSRGIMKSSRLSAVIKEYVKDTELSLTDTREVKA